MTSSGISSSASSGRSLLLPLIAVEKTFASATDMNDEVTKGRSFTYWDKREVIPAGTSSISNKANGIDVDHQRHRAALLGGFGVDDVCRAKTELDSLMTFRVLVQQETQIRRRLVTGRNSKDHGVSARSDQESLNLTPDFRSAKVAAFEPAKAT